jgi:hypothetical protein
LDLEEDTVDHEPLPYDLMLHLSLDQVRKHGDQPYFPSVFPFLMR